MKILVSLILIYTWAFAAEAAEKSSQPGKSPRIEKIINSYWTFNYFPEESKDAGYETAGFNDSKWPLVSIPHTWSTYETTGEIHPFIKCPSEKDSPYWWKGWGWYRKRFQVNSDISDKKVFVEFEGVQKYCKVWVNGKYLGDHKGGYGSFDFDITEHFARGKENILVVAVSNRQNDESRIPPMAAGNFNVYGGIYRDVKLVIRDRLYIPMQGSASHEGGTFVTTPFVSEKAGVVRVQTWVQNDYRQPKTCVLNTYIMDAANKVIQVLKTKATINPGQLYRFDQTFKPVKNPHLWSPGSPYIYKVWSEVTDGSRITDVYSSPLGFRWFWWNYSEDFLYVNGSKVLIHGGNRHQEYPWLGDAIPKWITEMDFRDMAENLNYNFMRTAHYPNDKYVYDLTDKYGIIIYEESPSTKNQDFSPEVQEQQMKEMIRRDRNHPSIMFWGMGSETKNPVSPVIAESEDTTRIITGDRITFAQGLPDKYLAFEKIAEGNTVTDYSRQAERREAAAGVTSGDPARIILTGSSATMTADLASVAILAADIVDAMGNHVYGANNSIRWSVTGPATLVGPSLYETDINRMGATEGVWYMDAPVSNVIRSAGKPGKIRVTASASGLASGSFEIEAVVAKTDNSVILDPVPEERGRLPVSKPYFLVSRLDEVPQEIKRIFEDLTVTASGKKGYEAAVGDFIISNNPSVDSTTVEFRALISLIGSHLVNNSGRMAADDYNFNVDHYNNCRLISGYIMATKLPPLYKETLKKYYSDIIINEGNEKNAGDEMNWLNWIPSGGTVVVSQDGSTPAWPKGTVITSKTALHDLIAAVYPVFDRYGTEARERALIFISKMNPYVVAQEITEGDSKRITYTAIKGKPILIPLIKFISE